MMFLIVQRQKDLSTNIYYSMGGGGLNDMLTYWTIIVRWEISMLL